ncbi:TIGR01666 family membrane protein [Labilibaculum filiforme]|uniref:TIGR01666 family membrane protein n=1 Tax=Labilibaculum filiforme TaxID=1940526 RepID=A0A2N3HYD4_9BACT|nr:YccS family putative transporter [Labilibaculum filiforme]PKQ63080.1 TIGR01666 family membrane protein [Labilibaculum filiforme]
MNKLTLDRFQGKGWYEFLVKNLWRYPNRLLALKAAIAMGLLLIPFLFYGAGFMGVTLALGALAGALSETDDHPKGRVKALALTIISFMISSASVEILRPFPILFGIGLIGSTITFIIVGGLGERYRGVTFGALLVAIYTMLGADLSPNWYWQPLLLPAGALCYGLLSLLLLTLRPNRLLEEQLAQAFEDLSLYMKEKARLFPSDSKSQEKIRGRLATLNIQFINSLERCKNVLNSYSDAVDDPNALRPYLHKFVLLQSLHERASSSHERYDLISDEADNTEILEGLGQLLLQLSLATHEVSKSLLMGTIYQHPVALKWTIAALKDKIAKQSHTTKSTNLSLLLQNLTQSHFSLQNMNYYVDSGLLPKVDRDTKNLWQKLREQLSWTHPRFRYAIRLSTCFLIGYLLILAFDLEKGYWILLTSLFVCQPSYSETRQRLFQRIVGTLSGVVIGVSIVQLLPTVAGQAVLMLVAAYAFFVWLRKNYAISVVFVTIFVIAAFNLIAGKGVIVMGARMMDTIIGALLAIAVVRFMWPDWQYKRLPNLLSSALEKNHNYFSAILLDYKESQEDDLNYRIARYRAHQADNALALSWRGMRLEPKKHQKFQKHAFTLTYLNHALLSYLSALGSHRDIKNYISDDQWEMFLSIEIELRKAVSGLQKSESCASTQSIKTFIDDLGQRITDVERGTERQKLVLLYNIAEVTEQLLQEASELFQE